jgi:hypothetical protein
MYIKALRKEGWNVNTQVNERILNKIKKALRLANAKNDHESHTAMLLAQQMMAKYNLSMEDIEIDSVEGARQKEVVEMYVTKPTKLQWWQKELANVIADNFRCYTYFRTLRGRSRLIFLGLKEDTQIAREVYAYAQDSIEYFSIRYLDQNGIVGLSERTKVRNDYIAGFIRGLRDKFREQVETNKDEWGLILVKDTDVVERYNKLNLKADSPSQATRGYNSEAIEAGYREGKRMDHTRKVLKG